MYAPAANLRESDMALAGNSSHVDEADERFSSSGASLLRTTVNSRISRTRGRLDNRVKSSSWKKDGVDE